MAPRIRIVIGMVTPMASFALVERPTCRCEEADAGIVVLAFVTRFAVLLDKDGWSEAFQFSWIIGA